MDLEGFGWRWGYNESVDIDVKLGQAEKLHVRGGVEQKSYQVIFIFPAKISV